MNFNFKLFQDFSETNPNFGETNFDVFKVHCEIDFCFEFLDSLANTFG